MKASLKIIPNMTFGQLTTICPDSTPRNDAHTYWLCQCSCGKICSVRSTKLRQLQTTSCGCDKKLIKNSETNRFCIDISGQKFGHWTALYPTNKRSGSRVMWYCHCDCGTEAYVDDYSLRAHLSESCGCETISRGEQKISQLLTDNNIIFETQKSFESCKYVSGFLAKFDFYVDNTYLIKYDGIQHFYEHDFFKCNHENDIFKNQWCFKNNIPLIRIPYTQYESLCINDLKLETSQFITTTNYIVKKEKKTMLKENSRKVFDYVKANDGTNKTATDIADALGLEVKSVNGIVTAAFQKKGLMERIPAEIKLPDGTHKPVKYIQLTDAGRAFDPDATE